MQNKNNAGNLMTALLIGAAIGGAIGILFAPDKGSETRKKISSKSDDLTDAVKDKFSKIADKFRKDVETIKDQAIDYAENGKSKVENFEKS